VAVLWLNQNYVTKSDFSNEIKSLRQDITQGQQQINSRIDALVNSVNAANTAIAVTQQRQSELDDLKQRIRDLERENRQK
jgi:polyhydroxyalkanoate synthesis regulator phasin